MSDNKEDSESTDLQGEKALAKINEFSKSRRAYSNVRRDLSDDELGSPAAQKLLLDNLDQLEREVFTLEEFREKFHQVDKDKAVLIEKLKTSQSSEILYSFTLTIGAALIGLAPTFWQMSFGWTIIPVGALLIIGGLTSKLINK